MLQVFPYQGLRTASTFASRGSGVTTIPEVGEFRNFQNGDGLSERTDATFPGTFLAGRAWHNKAITVTKRQTGVRLPVAEKKGDDSHFINCGDR